MCVSNGGLSNEGCSFPFNQHALTTILASLFSYETVSVLIEVYGDSSKDIMVIRQGCLRNLLDIQTHKTQDTTILQYKKETTI